MSNYPPPKRRVRAYAAEHGLPYASALAALSIDDLHQHTQTTNTQRYTNTGTNPDTKPATTPSTTPCDHNMHD